MTMVRKPIERMIDSGNACVLMRRGSPPAA
jgi:hypothetical protein